MSKFPVVVQVECVGAEGLDMSAVIHIRMLFEDNDRTVVAQKLRTPLEPPARSEDHSHSNCEVESMPS